MALTSGILAAYKFQNDYTDSSGAGGPTLSATGTPVFFSGKVGQAVAFHGYQGSTSQSRAGATNAIFSLRDNSGDPDLGKSITMTCWVYADVWTGTGGILSNWANGGPVQWLFYSDDDTHLTWQIRDKVSTDHGCRVLSPSSDAWHFFVCIYDASTGTLKLSVDNGSLTTNTTPSVIHGTGVVLVGNSNNGAAAFDAAVDALTLRNRVLTAAEITAVYLGGSGQEPPFVEEPTADFSADETSVIVGEDIDFSVESTNTP